MSHYYCLDCEEYTNSNECPNDSTHEIQVVSLKCVWKEKCQNVNKMTCDLCTRNLNNDYKFDYFEQIVDNNKTEAKP